jgi:hypothetical protein
MRPPIRPPTRGNIPAAACLVAWAGLLALSGYAHAAITKGPYLHNPGKTQMTVLWEADAPGEAKVVYGEGEALDKEAPALPPKSVSDGKLFLYAAVLAALKPGTTYGYQVVQGQARSALAAFRTVPDNPGAFTFVVYGDSRSLPEEHRRVAAAIGKEQPAFIVHTGDLVTSGNRYETWSPEFFEPLARVIGRIPLWPAVGNHEGNRQNYALFFPAAARCWYSFDYGDAHFVVLDYKTTPEMLAWLAQDLAASPARWKFVFCHYPSYNIGGHHSAWGRKDVVPLLHERHVDIAFSGHSHLYERFYPLVRRGGEDEWPVTYIITGGGGAPLHQAEAHPALAAFAPKLHYLVVAVDGDTLSLRCLTPDGELLDRLTIRKKGRRQDEDYRQQVRFEDEIPVREPAGKK